MLRIRQVIDDLLPIDQREIAQVQEILRDRFPAIPAADIDGLAEKLRNPFKHKFQSVLFVADDSQGNVRGFALVMHDPVLRFWFLDYIAAGALGAGGGIGGALYQRVRESAAATKPIGLFFECGPDDPAEVADPAILKQNMARLRFYARYGALPLINNAYRTPTTPGQTELPFLMYDDLDSGKPLRRDDARTVVRAILQRKYGDICTPRYINQIVASFADDVIPTRKPKSAGAPPRDTPLNPRGPAIPLVINDKHDIHHIRERGYVEAPARIAAIKKELDASGLFRAVKPRDFGDKPILATHDKGYVEYLRRACAKVPAGTSVYPYVFPIRNQARPPKDLTVRAGYYCIDTFTPLNPNAFPAAKRGVDCTLTAAEEILRGDRLAYALVRPPGHHAETRSYGGFCYFSNCAIAAQYLSRHGRVAILDIDYHHGNGQEEIFYNRDDVLTISIHGHPSFAYPYFSGFEDDVGAGPGEGFNVNYAMPEHVDGERYRRTLRKAIARIEQFRPRFLVIALGLDPAKGDPTGTWTLEPADFAENGKLIGAMRLPTLVVQEGGYRTRTLGVNARRFFEGVVAGSGTPPPPNETKPAHKGRK